MCLYFLGACGKKETYLPLTPPQPPPQPGPTPSPGEPQTQVSTPTTASPIPPTSPSLSKNVITDLIQEIKETRMFYYEGADEIEAVEQYTRNLATANTLEQIQIRFDKEGAPQIAIHTQEGSFKLVYKSHVLVHGVTSFHLVSEHSWIKGWFAPEYPIYEAYVEARGKFNNIAIINLKRISQYYTSEVQILYVKKSVNIKMGPYNPNDLLADSRILLKGIVESKNTTADFYHVLTELDFLNRSNATRFGIYFQPYFSLYGNSSIVNSNEPVIGLDKKTIYWGKFTTSNPAKNLFYKLKHFSQGSSYSLEEALYQRQSISNSQEFLLPIASSIMEMSFKMKSASPSSTQTIPITLELE